jgi:hypothetical protein
LLALQKAEALIGVTSSDLYVYGGPGEPSGKSTANSQDEDGLVKTADMTAEADRQQGASETEANLMAGATLEDAQVLRHLRQFATYNLKQIVLENKTLDQDDVVRVKQSVD